MSTDETITTDLIETLKDGKAGFEQAADAVAESDASLATMLRELSAQRAGFSAELQRLAAAYGDRIDEDGSTAAALHRGWMSLKDAVTGSDTDAVLKAALTGEDHAVSEYEKALDADISPNLRTVVQRQFADVRAARDRVAQIADG